jgi:hypothetical protein
MGMTVSVYRRSDRMGFFAGNDATNGGISRDADQLCIVNIPGIYQPSAEFPAALLVKHAPFGEGAGRVLARIVPAVPDGDGWKPDPRWPMFGGNYAACSDSRFWEVVRQLVGLDHCNGAIPIHDRFE